MGGKAGPPEIFVLGQPCFPWQLFLHRHWVPLPSADWVTTPGTAPPAPQRPHPHPRRIFMGLPYIFKLLNWHLHGGMEYGLGEEDNSLHSQKLSSPWFPGGNPNWLHFFHLHCGSWACMSSWQHFGVSTPGCWYGISFTHSSKKWWWMDIQGKVFLKWYFSADE